MSTASKTILIVDDQVEMVHMLRDLLLSKGYDVMIAHDGIQALAEIEKKEPHLIILDMNMPKMGGLAFYHKIANSWDGEAKYPIMVFTTRENMRDLFADLHVDGFMTKPFDLVELIDEIERIMSARYGAQKKVLLLEEDGITRDQLKDFFKAADFETIECLSEATLPNEARKHYPELILIRIAHPNLCGREFPLVKNIRSAETLADTAIVLYSFVPLECESDIVDSLLGEHKVNRVLSDLDIKGVLKECALVLQEQASPPRPEETSD